MNETLLTVIVVAGFLVVGLLGTLLLSAPLAGIAIWRYARTRRAKHGRALLVSLVNAVGQGLGAASLGFVFVAGIGDENAGSAVPLAIGGGLVGGAALAFLPSYLLVLLGCLVVDRSGQPCRPRDEGPNTGPRQGEGR